jgi:cell division protease FtsH
MIAVRYGESDGLAESEEIRWNTAVHEAGHAVVSHYLRRTRMAIWFGSIEKRGSTGGMVAPSPHTDDWQELHREMKANICVSQGSRVAELLVIGEASSGHGGDGPNATRIAEQIIYNGHTFTVDTDGTPYGQLSSYGSERGDEAFHELREAVLRETWLETWTLLEPRQDQVEAVAALLVEHGTVSGDLIHDLIDRMEAERAGV